MLPYAGLSCRRTSQLLTLLVEPVTHAPISAWYRRASHLFREAPVQRHERLVIDETSLHIEKSHEDWPEVLGGEVPAWASLLLISTGAGP